MYSLEFRLYQRHFRQPLQTSHGSWQVREGIILRLQDDAGRVGWGEIAPLPWFGSETLAQALVFCRQLGGEVTGEEMGRIPEEFPACQFGLESAIEDLSRAEAQRRRESGGDRGREGENFPYCYLLPAGEAALQGWTEAGERGEGTFKWKIGVGSLLEEMAVFQRLAEGLPPGAKLRLDANGGLSVREAQKWLEVADRAGMVEFIEQPLPPRQFAEMLRLCADYATPLALDESVANLRQLQECYDRGWPGILVIKAAIAGSPQRLRHFCQQNRIDAVFSSVLETDIGRQASLRLAAELSHSSRALGFGVNHWFKEQEDDWLDKLWNNC